MLVANRATQSASFHATSPILSRPERVVPYHEFLHDVSYVLTPPGPQQENTREVLRFPDRYAAAV